MTVGIGITVVILATTLPNLRLFTDPYIVDAASQMVAADFTVARMRAVGQNRRHRIVFDQAGGWWEIQGEAGPNVFTAVAGRRTLPAGMAFGTVSTTPIFDTRGMLTAAFRLAVKGEGRQRTVAVNVLGDATVSDAQTVAASEPVSDPQYQ